MNFKTVIRLKAITEKSIPIAAPSNWLPLSFLAENGQFVKKNKIIAKFDLSTKEFDLKSYLIQEEIDQTSLRQKLKDIDTQNIKVQDKLDAVNDQLAFKKAQLDRFKTLPLQDEVQISEGKLRIAQMNFDTADNDYKRGQSRFKNAMISKATLNKLRDEMANKKALLIFAQKALELVKHPKIENDKKKLALEIINLTLEKSKIENEIKENVQITLIRKKRTMNRRKRTQVRIKRAREALKNGIIRSPIDGFIAYKNSYYRKVVVGSKFWKDYIFMNIPDISTLIFKGVIRETERKYFNEKDLVAIKIIGQEDTVIRGRIISISKLAHDITEKTNGRSSETGINVYDVIVKPEGKITGIKPGMHANGNMFSDRIFKGPAIPISYLKFKNNNFYVSYKGIYQKIMGFRVLNYFFFKDKSWLGKKIHFKGVFLEKQAIEKKNENRFMASGELKPEESVDIVVPRIRRKIKIVWLIKEESIVKKGDLLVRFDSEEIDKSYESKEASLENVLSDKIELNKTQMLRKKEGDFKISNKKNEYKIAEIEKNKTYQELNDSGINSLLLELKKVNIALGNQKNKFKNHEKKAIKILSTFEVSKLKRDIARQTLSLEKVQLQLQREKNGKNKVEKSFVSLTLFTKKREFSVAEKLAEYQNLETKKNLKRNLFDIQYWKKELARINKIRKLLELRSPSDGMIKFTSVWTSGEMRKITLGSSVRQRSQIMYIPNLDKMYVSVDIPEFFYTKVKKGMKVSVIIPYLGRKELPAHISSIDFLFKNKLRKGGSIGIYSSQEPLGETVFSLRVSIDVENIEFKPGSIAEVYFPLKKP